MLKIIGEVNEIISNYNTQSLEILDGLNFQMAEMVRTIEFYSSSKYLFGQYDDLGKEKPFFNIVNAICDVENAAVDIDTKDITATADEPQDYDKSFLLSVELYEWMKEANFSFTLNELRDTRTRYGGVLAKKCIYSDDNNKKQLKIEVPEWKNLVVDPIDIPNGVIIEKHYMSPAELSKKSGVWDNISDAMKLATKQRISKGFVNKQATSKKIPIYEVRGEFSKAYYKESDNQNYEDEDKNVYSYQYYVLAGESNGKQFVLYKEDDTEKLYKYLPRKRKAGRSLGVGVVEENEQAQIWINDIVQKQQRALEITSKAIGQSASRSLKGRNLFTEVENGQILEHDDNKPITSLQMLPAGGMIQFENLITQWHSLTDRTSSTYAAQRGETPPSGTPFRLQAQVLSQSSSVFDDIREEMGIWISEIFYDWVLPQISKQLNKAHILSHNFSTEELKVLDDAYSQHKANEIVIEQILRGELVTAEEYAQAKQMALENVRKTKGHRFFDIPSSYYKDLKSKITINTTGEQRNKAATLESLNNILMTVGRNPSMLQDPVLAQVFTKIVELSGAGISPISLVAGIQEQAKQQQNQGPANKVSESINFKDLPPDGQIQLAKQAGITIQQGIAPQQSQPAQPQKQLSLAARA